MVTEGDTHAGHTAKHLLDKEGLFLKEFFAAVRQARSATFRRIRYSVLATFLPSSGFHLAETIRQCIQSLGIITLSKPGLNAIIASRFIPFNLMAVKETMRESILMRIPYEHDASFRLFYKMRSAR